MYHSFARRLTMVLALALALCLLSTSALCETSVPSVFANDIAPNGYHSCQNGITSLGISGPTSGVSVSTDRHNALIADGWVLVSVEVKEVPVSALYGIMPMSLTDEVVIEGTKVVEAHYEQPIKSKFTYNNVLFDSITNLNSLVTTIVSTQIDDPYLSWIPSAVGFVTQAVVDALARNKTLFTLTTTLRTYDIQVKKAGWPNYFTCASSERMEYGGTISCSGYSSDGTPIAISGDGRKNSQSEHYGNETWLTNKAIEYAKKNDDTYYLEWAPKVDQVRLY